jgi:hypothetical protein
MQAALGSPKALNTPKVVLEGGLAKCAGRGGWVFIGCKKSSRIPPYESLSSWSHFQISMKYKKYTLK